MPDKVSCRKLQYEIENLIEALKYGAKECDLILEGSRIKSKGRIEPAHYTKWAQKERKKVHGLLEKVGCKVRL